MMGGADVEHSTRTYHYKRNYLGWEIRFEQR